ncbi:TetR/AcrR family transcriptional regulator [Nocardioides marmotae]|uniref:TetR/AcrR family transcriptional regulator n=1 Tax=Nocardioides marmotae TaxID=2663857 RepID=UPI001659EC8D|nr:TetR/AcrR family transcriptional regulator [Nocardioides marmotae]MBC9734306.1 TetR/AcrR family transcriptional regulator [Nocardioides marmotae]
MPRPSRWDDVVAAAARVFSEKGFGGASLEDVATEVGMLKGSLYNYIRSKEDLLFAVVRPDAEELLGRARELAGADLPASEKLRQITAVHVGIIDRHLPYVSVYVQEIAGKGISPEWAEMDREYISLVEQIIRDGVAEGVFDGRVEPRIAARAMIGSLNWLTRWYEPGGPARASEVAGQLSDFFLPGLLARRRA